MRYGLPDTRHGSHGDNHTLRPHTDTNTPKPSRRVQWQESHTSPSTSLHPSPACGPCKPSFSSAPPFPPPPRPGRPTLHLPPPLFPHLHPPPSPTPPLSCTSLHTL
eukprot:GHVQ01016595.1.p2 GENE.GHVQ01016595.1~~GHVQ01016595.1.p2  ORF type:complete len:106 (+),score=21.37 GHVQ01016595.1:112-429(+)